jgi:hypothetical protein
MASKVVFGCPELEGLGMLNLHIEQNILNSQLLEKALFDKQMAGTITKTAIHHWKWQLGTWKNPFESEYKYPHNESQWLNELRKFTIQYQVKVNIEEAEYPLKRDNDKYIMELAEDLGFSSCKLRFLNHYRIFLNVISLSDIVNESGRSFDPTVTNLKKLPGKQLSDICIQHKSDHTKWSIWFRFINLITNARQDTLKQPLGAWSVNQDQIRKKFSSYRTSNKLYREQDGTAFAKNITKVAGT